MMKIQLELLMKMDQNSGMMKEKKKKKKKKHICLFVYQYLLQYLLYTVDLFVSVFYHCCYCS